MSNDKSDTPKRGRIRQMREAYKLTKTVQPMIGWFLLALFLGILAVFVIIGLLLDSPIYFLIIGIPFAVLGVVIIFSRKAESAAYSQIEGQPGAAAAALQTLRSGWFVTPAVSVTKNQDIVHRVVGRPGVVLVAEAPASRAAALLANERKRTARFVPDMPIHEIVMGDGEGQVPLRKLQRSVMKLPRALRPAEVTALRKRLDALTTTPLPIPKGPMPKGGRVPRGPRA
ncbi:MAG TPA: DUF4191 domain-containing protein [Candidatus Nanopelagicales bacterium]